MLKSVVKLGLEWLFGIKEGPVAETGVNQTGSVTGGLPVLPRLGVSFVRGLVKRLPCGLLSFKNKITRMAVVQAAATIASRGKSS